jgi:hypothetical protein
MSPERTSIAWRGAPVQRAAAAGVEPSTAVYNIMLKELRLEGDGDGFERLKVVGLRRPCPGPQTQRNRRTRARVVVWSWA